MKKSAFKTLLIIITSIVLGIIYIPIIFDTSIGTAYTNLIPEEFEVLWGIIPLIIIVSLIAFIIRKSKKELYILLLTGNLVCVITYLIFSKILIVTI